MDIGNLPEHDPRDWEHVTGYFEANGSLWKNRFVIE